MAARWLDDPTPTDHLPYIPSRFDAYALPLTILLCAILFGSVVVGMVRGFDAEGLPTGPTERELVSDE